MAGRTPTMTTEECERELGPRGNLQVTQDNRRTVRKWLNAQGFPSLFSGGLSMRELALAYNDTSGRQIDQLKRKLDEASTGEEDQQAQEAGAADDFDFAAGKAAPTPAATETAGNPKGATVAGSNKPQTLAEKLAAGMAQEDARDGHTATAATPKASGDDMSRVIAAVTAALSAMGPATDPDAVRRIATEVVHDKAILKDHVGDVIGQIVKEIEATVDRIEQQVARNAVRIEIKDGDTVREIDGRQHEQFPKLLRAAASRQPDGFHPNIWISGPAGSGKTYAAKMVAKALEAEFFYNGALSMPHELLGFIDAGGTYHETPFHQAYTAKAVYLFDEVDGSDNSALLALNAALANGCASFPNGQRDRHIDSVIIATANTWGLGATADYVGRAKIDAAFLSRFPVRIFWDYDKEMEAQICGNPQWAARVQKAREKARAAGIKVLIDPRATIAGAGLIANGFTSDETASLTYLANLTPEQRQMVEAR